jgi:LPXTG-motif cell wall-anchored protein
MKRFVILSAVLAVLSWLLLPGPALAQSLRAPVTKYTSRFDAVTPPGQFDQVSLVLDFAPGVWTPPYAPGGQWFATVAEGELTLRQKGAERKVRAGETWAQNAGDPAEVGNAGPAKARALVSVLLPKGAPLTADQTGTGAQNPPRGPTAVHRATHDVGTAPTPLEVVQLLVEFPAGSWTPWHTHAGQPFVLVIDGEVTLQRGAGDERFAVGQTWLDPGEVVHRAGAVTGPAAVFGGVLQAKGAAITTVQPGQTGLAAAATAPTQLPRTGSIGFTELAAAGVLLAAGGRVFWRRRGRRGRGS